MSYVGLEPEEDDALTTCFSLLQYYIFPSIMVSFFSRKSKADKNSAAKKADEGVVVDKHALAERKRTLYVSIVPHWPFLTVIIGPSSPN